MELAEAKEVEGRRAAYGPIVHDAGGANVPSLPMPNGQWSMLRSRVERVQKPGRWVEADRNTSRLEAESWAPFALPWRRRLPVGPRYCHATEKRQMWY